MTICGVAVGYEALLCFPCFACPRSVSSISRIYNSAWVIHLNVLILSYVRGGRKSSLQELRPAGYLQPRLRFTAVDFYESRFHHLWSWPERAMPVQR